MRWCFTRGCLFSVGKWRVKSVLLTAEILGSLAAMESDSVAHLVALWWLLVAFTVLYRLVFLVCAVSFRQSNQIILLNPEICDFFI